MADPHILDGQDAKSPLYNPELGLDRDRSVLFGIQNAWQNSPAYPELTIHIYTLSGHCILDEVP